MAESRARGCQAKRELLHSCLLEAAGHGPLAQLLAATL